MAAMYPGQVSAVQVGSFFVKQYYEIIQQTPQYGYQFYSDASTAIRIDGDIEQTAKSAVGAGERLGESMYSFVIRLNGAT